jgi:hypothetical protein
MYHKIVPAAFMAVLVCATIAPVGAEQPELAIQILATFDYPGTGNSTVPQAINEQGDITGFYNDASGATIGFIRFRDGSFSPPLIDPNDTGNFTQARGINDARVVCGYYSEMLFGFFHGFFFGNNLFTDYDVPGATSTVITGINNLGDFVGEFASATQAFTAYSNIGGTVTAINVPGATNSSSFAINDANEIVGQYTDSAAVIRGFYQDPAGGLLFPIEAPGATTTFLFGISNRSQIVGRFLDSGNISHGLLLKLPNRFVQYDYPGALFTSLNGINSRGFICGRYNDGSGVFHGFIGRVR